MGKPVWIYFWKCEVKFIRYFKFNIDTIEPDDIFLLNSRLKGLQRNVNCCRNLPQFGSTSLGYTRHYATCECWREETRLSSITRTEAPYYNDRIYRIKHNKHTTPQLKQNYYRYPRASLGSVDVTRALSNSNNSKGWRLELCHFVIIKVHNVISGVNFRLNIEHLYFRHFWQCTDM